LILKRSYRLQLLTYLRSIRNSYHPSSNTPFLLGFFTKIFHLCNYEHMPSNIFIDLSSYPYNPARNPRENQHTMFLSYLLNSNKSLLVFLLKKLLTTSKLVSIITASDLNDISCFALERTLRQIVYPDMKVTTTDSSLVVYIENKIESFERQPTDDDASSQLQNYLRLAKTSPTKEAFVVYLTKHHEDISPIIEADKQFAGQFTWSMVSDFIRDFSGQIFHKLATKARRQSTTRDWVDSVSTRQCCMIVAPSGKDAGFVLSVL